MTTLPEHGAVLREPRHVRHLGAGLLALYDGDNYIRDIGGTPGWNFMDRDEFIVRYNAHAALSASPPVAYPPGLQDHDITESGHTFAELEAAQSAPVAAPGDGFDWLRRSLRGIAPVGQYLGKATILRDSVLDMMERWIATDTSWQQAVVNACMRIESGFVATDPEVSIRAIEQWWYSLGVETTANGFLVEQAAAPTAPPVAVDGWQRIETAPLGDFLVSVRGWVTAAYRNHGEPIKSAALHEPFCDPPTHWQPLPAAPASKGASHA